MQHILILADATPSIGSGHVMRCIALAQAAQASGFLVHLLSNVQIDWVHRRLEQEKISFLSRPAHIHLLKDPNQLLSSVQILQKSSWVVLDGYHFNTNCQKILKDTGCRLLVIDDYNHLPEYHCDILLNQNVGAENLAYKGNIGTKLLGPKFALIRKEFLAVRKKRRARSGPARHILFSLGGGDFSAMLPGLASQFITPEIANCTLRIVAGEMPPDKIRQAFTNCPAQIEILKEIESMPELMCWADICVSAGGSTCWELCCMNLPFLTIELAENQKEIIKYLEQQHIAQRFCRKTLQQLLTKNNTPSQKSLFVDGLGAKRALSFLSEKV